MKSLRDIEERLLKGDSVTTPELERANQHFARLRDDLGDLGPHWHFAFVEANRLWSLTRQYLEARE